MGLSTTDRVRPDGDVAWIDQTNLNVLVGLATAFWLLMTAMTALVTKAG